MLREMTIVGGKCFGESPMTVSDMRSGNFFYGPNGSGKTTIGQAFSGYGSPKLKPEWHDGAEMAVRVYNRDLADQILSESNRIPGVFVLGENSVEAQKRLEQIEMPSGERAQAVEARGRALPAPRVRSTASLKPRRRSEPPRGASTALSSTRIDPCCLLLPASGAWIEARTCL